MSAILFSLFTPSVFRANIELNRLIILTPINMIEHNPTKDNFKANQEFSIVDDYGFSVVVFFVT